MLLTRIVNFGHVEKATGLAFKGRSLVSGRRIW